MIPATVVDLLRDEEDGTLHLRVRCGGCRAHVLHAAGSDLDDVPLGVREADCCGEHELVDPHRIVQLRLRVLRAQDADFQEHLRVVAYNRRVAAAESAYARALREINALPLRDRTRVQRRREARRALDAVKAALPAADAEAARSPRRR